MQSDGTKLSLSARQERNAPCQPAPISSQQPRYSLLTLTPSLAGPNLVFSSIQAQFCSQSMQVNISSGSRDGSGPQHAAATKAFILSSAADDTEDTGCKRQVTCCATRFAISYMQRPIVHNSLRAHCGLAELAHANRLQQSACRTSD